MIKISSNAEVKALFTAYLPAAGDKKASLDLTIDALDGWSITGGATLAVTSTGYCVAPDPDPRPLGAVTSTGYCVAPDPEPRPLGLAAAPAAFEYATA
jgi:hypothetical protein